MGLVIGSSEVVMFVQEKLPPSTFLTRFPTLPRAQSGGDAPLPP